MHNSIGAYFNVSLLKILFYLKFEIDLLMLIFDVIFSGLNFIHEYRAFPQFDWNGVQALSFIPRTTYREDLHQ